jgi:hypothetical protein
VDELRLDVRCPPGFPRDSPEAAVVPIVNGKSIHAHLRILEDEFIGFHPARVFLPARRFLGDLGPAERLLDDDAHVPLLSCRCGVPDCGGVAVLILVEPQRVVWRDFVWSEAPEDPIPGLREFAFDRRRYEEQLWRAPWSEEPVQRTWPTG